jgi:AcrR family transcriptional regulator
VAVRSSPLEYQKLGTQVVKKNGVEMKKAGGSEPRLRSLKKEVTRKKILEAALINFSTKGYSGTRIQDLVEAAKISPGLFYVHYADKSDLLAELLKQGWQEVSKSFTAGLKAGPREALEALTQVAEESLTSQRLFWRVLYGLRWDEAAVTITGQILPNFHEEVLTYLENVMVGLGYSSPRDEAALFYSALDGLCQQEVLIPGGFFLKERLSRLVAHWPALGIQP